MGTEPSQDRRPRRGFGRGAPPAGDGFPARLDRRRRCPVGRHRRLSPMVSSTLRTRDPPPAYAAVLQPDRGAVRLPARRAEPTAGSSSSKSCGPTTRIDRRSAGVHRLRDLGSPGPAEDPAADRAHPGRQGGHRQSPRPLVGSGNVAGPTLSSLGNDFGLAPLLGKPLAVISDARLNGRGNSDCRRTASGVSGEDTITVNRKYRDQWTENSQPGSSCCRTSSRTSVTLRLPSSAGSWPCSCTRSWLGNEDLDLEPSLHEELPGILNWTLDGLERLTRQGRFTRPDYTDEVLITLADLASPVSAFVRDQCDRNPMLTAKCSVLYDRWKAWAEDNGQRPGTAQTFGRNLRAVVPGVRVERPRDDTERTRWYRGIGVKGQR